jgi:hypothetical protein
VSVVTDETRGLGYFCIAKEVYRWSLTNPTGATSVNAPLGPGPGSGNFVACGVDPATDSFWAATSGKAFRWSGASTMTTASVPTTQSSPNLVTLVVSSSGYVVFGGTNYIVATPTSSLSLGQPRTLSATPLVGIAYNTGGTVIFGDSVGEVYEVSPSTLSTINLYFQASSTFSAFTIDYVHNVLFAAHYNSSGDMFIARIELDNFSLFGRLLLSGTGVIGAGVFDNSANVMYWGSNQNYVYTVTPTNCTALGCIFCVDDPNYWYIPHTVVVARIIIIICVTAGSVMLHARAPLNNNVHRVPRGQVIRPLIAVLCFKALFRTREVLTAILW